jgi:hypothetical protein
MFAACGFKSSKPIREFAIYFEPSGSKSKSATSAGIVRSTKQSKSLSNKEAPPRHR